MTETHHPSPLDLPHHQIEHLVENHAGHAAEISEGGHAHGAEHDPFADSPGRQGPYATEEVDPHSVGSVHTQYAPKHDGQPDPGEVVWTWVPYEEHDGRGKDRPVLLVAREKEGARRDETLLAIKLTSKWHADAENWVDVGAGNWDREARESWAVIDRVMRVHHDGIRREGCAMERADFDKVIEHLHQRYRWS
ncbi:type II toxin-antitoxin system PemK/MazF family toxin [Actinospica robiniae]|uniref:type II toxin-antitoxin system PemK/MazF family toxin n=1 Tax=Actinospica robiniae TaxID=304901 RepID=UPI0003FF7C51|nr:type II toxin-antitoxin system PemK/MazF family toxin [Actinospica robiniae]